MSDALPQYDFDFNPPERERRGRTSLLNAAATWVHDSSAAKSVEDALARLNHFGWLGPQTKAGYNPFLDERLDRYADSLGMFRDSRSPEETAYIMQRIDGLRERERHVSEMDGMLRFIVGAFTLESLATWRVNTIARGRTALESAMVSGAATGAFAGGLTGLMIAGDEGNVPGSMKQDMLSSVAYSALFGAALGAGIGAIVSRKSADDLADRFLAVHGPQTPPAPRPLPEPPGGGGPPEPPPGAASTGAPPPGRGVRFGDFKPSEEALRQQGRRRADQGEQMEGPPIRLTDDEIAGQVEGFTPGPVERYIEDGEGGGRWVTDRPTSGVQPHVDAVAAEAERIARIRAQIADETADIADPHARQAAIRELEAERLFPDAELRSIEADLDTLGGPRTKLTAANDETVRAEIEVRLDAIARLFDRLLPKLDEANDNISAARLRLLAAADDWFAELAADAANLNINLWRRKDGGPRGVWWDSLRGTYDDGAPRPAGNDNTGGGRPSEPPAPAVIPPGGGAGGPPPPGGGGGGPPGGPPLLARPALPEMVDKDRIAPGAGAEKITWAQMPWYVLKNNRIPGVLGNAIARLADEIVQIPGLRLRGAEMGLSGETASVQAMASARHSARYVAADQAHAEAYFRYRGWDVSRAGSISTRFVQLAEGARDWMQGGRRGADMSLAEFDMQVMRAIEDPNASAIAEVREAAQAWREKVLDPMADEAAAAGVILTPNHAGEALQAIDRQFTTIAALEDRMTTLGLPRDHPLWHETRQWREMLDNRALAATEMAGEARIPYVPHVAMQRAIKENRGEFVRRLAEWWSSGQSRRESQWAHPLVRAEIATSHVLNAGVGNALENALHAHLTVGGMSDLMARARAIELSAAVKAAEEAARPNVWRREWNALTNQLNDGPDGYTFLHPAVREALEAVGLEPTRKLVEEIAPPERFSSRERALPGHSRERTIDAPLSIMGDFYDLNARSVLADYVRNMGAAIEMGRRFGDPSMLGRIIGLELDMLEGGVSAIEMARVTQATRDLRDHVLGRFAAPENADAWSVRTLRLLQSHAIVTQMGRTLISALTDTGRVIMEHGFRPMADGVWQAIVDAEGFSLARREARLAGAATELVLLGRSKSLYDLQSSGADRSLVERVAHGAVETMMFVNLLAPWTQIAQEFAGALTQHTVAEISIKIAAGRASPAEVARMAQLGIDLPMAEKIALNYMRAGAQRHSGLLLLNTEAWQDRALVEQLRAAIKTSVDSQVVKPGIADRPNFLSAPLAQGLLMYKSFAIASTQRTLMAGLQRRDALVLQGMLASVAIAWMFTDPPGGDKDRNPIFNSHRLSQAIEKSGVLGIVGDLNNAVEGMSGHSLGIRPLLGLDPPLYAKRNSWADQMGAALGPAISPWLNLTWALTAPEAKSDEIAGAIRRHIWFQNLIYISDTTRALSREAGTFMHTPAER
jgi:hypothetical protein